VNDKPQSAQPVITARDVGVKFSIYGPRQSMKQRVVNSLFRPKTSFWALRNVSFDIGFGEAFFVVGRNGAGKTTLLKVMAETLLPDTGTVTVSGEISAFLSMGLGFRPDLSGYDNMELALRFMGVPPSEVSDLREDIAEFTQLGMFLDAPVYTYSSGMRARLAFAIATSIEPEILIMDEVINAGDEEFREKCQERLDRMLSHAKAIVVCTHNLRNVREMATRAMWIDQGQVQYIGKPDDVVERYGAFIKEVRRNALEDYKRRKKRFIVKE